MINNEELSGKSIFVLRLQLKCQACNPVKMNSIIFFSCYYALEIHRKTSVHVKRQYLDNCFFKI